MFRVHVCLDMIFGSWLNSWLYQKPCVDLYNTQMVWCVCSYFKTSSQNFDLPRTARLSPALATQMTSRWTMAHTFGAEKRQQREKIQATAKSSKTKGHDLWYIYIYLWRMHMKKSFQKQADCDQRFHPCTDLENHHSRKVQSDYHSSSLNSFGVWGCLGFNMVNENVNSGVWIAHHSTRY